MALRVREFFVQQPLGGPCGPYPWRVTGDPPRRGVPLAYAVVGTALPPGVILDEVAAWQHLHLTTGEGPGLEDPAGEVWIWAALQPMPGEDPTLATELRPPAVLVRQQAQEVIFVEEDSPPPPPGIPLQPAGSAAVAAAADQQQDDHRVEPEASSGPAGEDREYSPTSLGDELPAGEDLTPTGGETPLLPEAPAGQPAAPASLSEAPAGSPAAPQASPEEPQGPSPAAPPASSEEPQWPAAAGQLVLVQQGQWFEEGQELPLGPGLPIQCGGARGLVSWTPNSWERLVEEFMAGEKMEEINHYVGVTYTHADEDEEAYGPLVAHSQATEVGPQSHPLLQKVFLHRGIRRGSVAMARGRVPDGTFRYAIAAGGPVQTRKRYSLFLLALQAWWEGRGILDAPVWIDGLSGAWHRVLGDLAPRREGTADAGASPSSPPGPPPRMFQVRAAARGAPWSRAAAALLPPPPPPAPQQTQALPPPPPQETKAPPPPPPQEAKAPAPPPPQEAAAPPPPPEAKVEPAGKEAEGTSAFLLAETPPCPPAEATESAGPAADRTRSKSNKVRVKLEEDPGEREDPLGIAAGSAAPPPGPAGKAEPPAEREEVRLVPKKEEPAAEEAPPGSQAGGSSAAEAQQQQPAGGGERDVWGSYREGSGWRHSGWHGGWGWHDYQESSSSGLAGSSQQRREGPDAKRARGETGPPQVCRRWMQFNCNAGSQCRFLHTRR